MNPLHNELSKLSISRDQIKEKQTNLESETDKNIRKLNQQTELRLDSTSKKLEATSFKPISNKIGDTIFGIWRPQHPIPDQLIETKLQGIVQVEKLLENPNLTDIEKIKLKLVIAITHLVLAGLYNKNSNSTQASIHHKSALEIYTKCKDSNYFHEMRHYCDYSFQAYNGIHFTMNEIQPAILTLKRALVISPNNDIFQKELDRIRLQIETKWRQLYNDRDMTTKELTQNLADLKEITETEDPFKDEFISEKLFPLVPQSVLSKLPHYKNVRSLIAKYPEKERQYELIHSVFFDYEGRTAVISVSRHEDQASRKNGQILTARELGEWKESDFKFEIMSDQDFMNLVLKHQADA